MLRGRQTAMGPRWRALLGSVLGVVLAWAGVARAGITEGDRAYIVGVTFGLPSTGSSQSGTSSVADAVVGLMLSMRYEAKLPRPQEPPVMGGFRLSYESHPARQWAQRPSAGWADFVLASSGALPLGWAMGFGTGLVSLGGDLAMAYRATFGLEWFADGWYVALEYAYHSRPSLTNSLRFVVGIGVLERASARPAARPVLEPAGAGGEGASVRQGIPTAVSAGPLEIRQLRVFWASGDRYPRLRLTVYNQSRRVVHGFRGVLWAENRYGERVPPDEQYGLALQRSGLQIMPGETYTAEWVLTRHEEAVRFWMRLQEVELADGEKWAGESAVATYTLTPR